jgi:hypothetical protein
MPPGEILLSNLSILKYQYLGITATVITVLVPSITEKWNQQKKFKEADEKE